MADRSSTDPQMVTLPDERVRQRRRKLDPEQEAAVTADPTDEQILTLARKRFKTASESEAKLRLEMLEDMRFRAGLQWPDQILTDRTLDKRPTLTVNRLPQFIKQITNPQRQMRPSVQINPVGDGADVDTAEVIQGLVRHIENTSHAEVAIDEAYEDAVTIGRGWFRVLTEYVDDGGDTFDQDIVVKRIANPFTVYVDPAAQELDYSDARFMFIVEDVPNDEYLSTYGDPDFKSLELFMGQGDRMPDWFPEGKVRIAEYWYVQEDKEKLALIQDAISGRQITVPFSTLSKDQKKRVIKTRIRKNRQVYWVKMNGGQVLSKQKWPGKYIPIIPVLGDEINMDGRKDLVGVVRYARDPQRMYNYWISAQTETIALAPRSPFIGASGQFKGHEDQWKLANTRNFAYLEYETIDSLGKPVPPPQRQVFEPPIRAIVEATKQADNDLKAVIGFYDASLGQPGPDQSGKAILARQKQGETANVNFIDNLGRALWHYGRVVLDLIPHIYDTPRVINIMQLDDTRKDITINQPFIDPKGVQRAHMMGVGRYNVTLSIGPNYQSLRQEGVASMLQLVSAAPQMIPFVGDLLVAEMDWPMARQISARLKKMLPPQLQDDEQQQQQPQIPPQMQAQMQALMQQHDLLTRALNDATETIRTKKLELASKEFIAAMQTRAALAIGLEKVNAQLAQARLEQEIQANTDLMNANHERLMDELADVRQFAFQQQQSQQQAQQQQAQQQAQGQQQAALSQQEHQQALQQNAQQAALNPPAPPGGGSE